MSSEITKIPKRLFFIWFGYTPPDYVKFCIDSFTETNSGFDVVFLKRTVEELEKIYHSDFTSNIYDKIIKDCMKYVLYETKYTEYIRHQKQKLYKENLRFIQLLSDVVRVELINEIGGIYLDCDTYPIRSFDDRLLSIDKFCVKRHYIGRIDSDNYFMGSKSKNITSEIVNPLKSSNIGLLQTNDKWNYDSNFLINKYNFYSLKSDKIKFRSDNKFYIEHYNKCSWNKKNGNIITIPYSEMDFLLKHC